MLACYPRAFRRENEDEILAALTALWLVTLASVVLIFSKASWPYCRRHPARRVGTTG